MRVDTGRLRVVAGDAESPEMEDGPPSPGAYIREHRVRRGLSLEQLASETKIPRTSLELLEDDRYDELPGMVFVKGFYRCCARALELDPETVLALLFEREREAQRMVRRDPTGGLPVARSGRADRLSDIRERLLTSRLILWVLVVFFVILVVFVAFQLASGPQSPDMRS